MMKIELLVQGENAVAEATELSRFLKDRNLRSVKVEQKQAEPSSKQEGEEVERESLGAGELQPWLELLVQSGFALGVVKEILNFFKERMRMASEERIKKEEIALEREKLHLLVKFEKNGQKHQIEINPDNIPKAEKQLDELLSGGEDKA